MYESLLNGGQIAKVVTLLPEQARITKYPLGWGGGRSKGALLSHCPEELDITSDYGSQKPQNQPPHVQITQHSL